jgi:hypothetical protein
VALFWKTRNVTVDQCLFQFAAGQGKAGNITVDKTSDGTIGPLNRYDSRVPQVVRERK